VATVVRAMTTVRQHPGGVELTLQGIARRFESTGVVAIESLDLHVPAGQFLAIIGPSGCGKSTLLRVIAGLDHFDAGKLSMRAVAEPDAETSNRVAYVFQDAHLLPWRSVLRNVALPLELSGVPKQRRLNAAREAITSVGLSDAVDRYPAQLSGGMRMRVSLARALVTDPTLLLLDEPFAALDEITRQQLDDQLRRLWRERGMTVLFVTHSIGEAAFLADRAIVLSRRPARVVLDHALDLPAERTMALRTDPAFARQTRLLFDALQRGGAC
jgi:NitT/TauT family transport system ATP-binding protein